MHLRIRLLCCQATLFAAAALAQAPVQFDWQLDATLPARRNLSLAYHEASGRTLLFGGEAFEIYGDTWTFDQQWQRAAGSPGPSPRMNASLAYDSTRQRVILFGGRTHTAVLGETWAFDGANWTQLAPTASPSPRYGGACVYDSVRDRVVMWGGWTSLSSGPVLQLWEFDGATWQLRPQNGAAPTVFGGSLVFDPARAATLLLGSTLLAWDGVAWQTRSTTGLPQPAPWGPMVFDPDTQRVLLVNPFSSTAIGVRLAAAYAWAGGDWFSIGTPTVPTDTFLSMEWDRARHRIVGVEVLDSSAIQQRTWVFEQGAWQVAATSAPRGREDAAMAYDSQRRRLVAHGGNINFSTQFDTLELGDRTWFVGAGGVSGPLSRRYHAMAFDEARGQVVMFGGTDFGQTGLMVWDGSGAWSHPPGAGPVARRTPAMAYDSLRARIVVFGGEAISGNLADLWAWNGVAWTQLSTTASPPARREAQLSYDRVRDRLVLFGGTTGTTPFGDTWEYDGAQWQALAPALAPTPRSRHVQVYDSSRQLTVLFGGVGAQAFRDTWTFDGSTWTQQQTAHVPDVGHGVCGAYDSHRRELVVFGGSTARGETWRLRDVGLGPWSSFGQGCDAGGAGSLALTALDSLAIGASCRLVVSNLPTTFAALPIGWAGFQNQSWNGLPLPIPLTTLGAPGCFLWADPAVPVPLLALGNGDATATLALADNPVFVGVELFVQAGVWDFTQARAGTANAIGSRVGVR